MKDRIGRDRSGSLENEGKVDFSLAIPLKRLLQFLFLIWITPRILLYHLSGSFWGREQAFLAASESIGRIAGMRGVYMRQAFYRRILGRCGRDIYIGWNSVFSKTSASIGENAYIGRRCGIGLADIGDRVMLADGVQILSGGRQHGQASNLGESHIDQPQKFELVTIGPGAWLGTNSIIMADVGEGAIVGAGAVVNKPVPARSIAVGVPARVVRELHQAQSSEPEGPPAE